MKSLAVLFFLLLLQAVFGQEDSTKLMQLREVSVSAIQGKEMVFKDSKYYILDFYVGGAGNPVYRQKL